MNTNFRRVFWHEIGHLIAHYYNHKSFSRSFVEKIEIKEEIINQRKDYEGFLHRIKPFDYTPGKYPVKHLPDKIATLIYGCLMESVFLRNNFEYCFNPYNIHAHGKCDSKAFWSLLFHFGIKNEQKEKLFSYIKEYANSFQSSALFNKLYNVEIHDCYFEKERGIYPIYLEEILAKINFFIEEHKNAYLEFIEKIKTIIDRKTE